MKLIDNLYTDGMIKLSCLYKDWYVKDGRSFVRCFISDRGVKFISMNIVAEYKKIGAFDDCLKCGKDFVAYANKQDLPDRWKAVLADILLIIYNLK